MRQQRWEDDWQETDLDDGWTVRESLVMQGGRRVVSALAIRPTSAAIPAGGITARLLRRVKVGHLARGFQHSLAKYFGAAAADRVFNELGWSAGPRLRRRPRRRRVDDRYYAELARDYVALCRQGDRKPTRTLAQLRDVPPDQMRSHVHLARANGFLSATTRGTASGSLTPKAARALSAAPRAAPDDGQPPRKRR
jgi:hypothetical protein